MQLDENAFPSLVFEQDGPRLTVKIRPYDEPKPSHADIHWEMGKFFSDIRSADDVRVIVLTGLRDGTFCVGNKTEVISTRHHNHYIDDPHGMWRAFMGITRTHEALLALEKPVIARVNGDCFSFGQAIMYGCDIVVAAEDARIAEVHLSLGEGGVEPYGPRYGVAPGDGGMVYVPLYMAPPLAKEYLMLSPVVTGRELADRRLINYALPLEQLDSKIDELVAALLKRPAHALAWTKRLANRHLVQQANLTLDAAAAHEMISFYQAEKNNWENRQEL
ncbi:enoyl-CoA hydratase/isomerase family protein [Dactylosporangium sp. NPDC050688]|uniref:enoyl-CoA hydratase/isomerase family protein n=1 Tax=Dactylosporangium sp. NPDC050688 TaxID=3157217 RepID=UPI003410E522